VLVIAAARAASADDDASLERALAHLRAPGFANDPVAQDLGELLAVRTRDGFSLSGGLPSEAAVWIDQFAVPGFHHGGRSAFTIDGLRGVHVSQEVDATVGDTSAGLVELSTRVGDHLDRVIGDVSTREAIAAFRDDFATAVVRTSLLGFAASPGGERVFVDAPNAQDAQLRLSIYKHDHVEVMASAFASRDQIAVSGDALDDFGRATIAAHYADGEWTATAAQSIGLSKHRLEHGLVQRANVDAVSLDSREELRHRLTDIAGLGELSWTLGAEAHVTRHDLDLAGPADDRENIARAGVAPFDDVSHVYRGIVWTPDVAGAAGLLAVLAKNIDVYAGVRVDAFGSDVALEPRGALAIDLGAHRSLELSAGAFRRAAEQGEELEHVELHPERTSRIELQLHQLLGSTFYNGSVYYADRTHLIVRDQLGHLANTGNGTTYGAYALLGQHRGHWIGQLAVRLEHDDRQDAPRGVVRPFEYSQPIRLEARLVRFVGPWSFGARWELRQGLPYTQVAGSDYDSDRDVYTPLFGDVYGERLPWQHQLDVRIDRAWRRIGVFLDVANVYDHRDTIGWAYNFDFTHRRAVQGPPIFPTVGVRGQL
jgi:hypothetical protein